MRIAVIAWGSLVWDPKELDFEGEWFDDGPLLPVEFARISNNGRLTLVLGDQFKEVSTLWSIMKLDTLDLAIASLQKRENMPSSRRVGFVDVKNKLYSSKSNLVKQKIEEWCVSKGLDAVIWTDLGVKFKDSIGVPLSIENICQYLSSLDGQELYDAKEYILNTPIQIETRYRQEIINSMEWK